MDRLSTEIAMARAAGMSYGKWKVLHPGAEHIAEVKPIEQEREVVHPGSENIEEVKPVEPEVILEEKSYARGRKPGKCLWCGKQIPLFDDKGRKTRYDKKTCSNACRQTRIYYRIKDGATDE